MTTETQTQFATRLGVDKSHITRLKQAGRLVMTDGKVDVEASLQCIKETEGGRDDVAARHAEARGGETKKPDESRVSAQTRKEMAQADIAEMERDKLRGKLIDREQVEMALDDVVAFARQGLENLPHRVAARLVGKDFDQIMATLKQEIAARMGDMHKEANKQLVELTKGGDEIDRAQEREQTDRARAIAAAARDIPKGIPGECGLCGEHLQRLILGACAPCRDKHGLK